MYYICSPFHEGLFFMLARAAQWGCFGFDSIRHWIVSTSGSVGQPVNLDLQTISWQQLLCTRCVVCKAHYLNPRRQGCVADEYPSRLQAGYVWNSGYHSNQMLGVTPLSSAKIQGISLEQPVLRQLPVENQSETKRVESYLVRCLDGGSSPPISTIKADNQPIR